MANCVPSCAATADLPPGGSHPIFQTDNLLSVTTGYRRGIAWGLLIAVSVALHLWQLDDRTFHSDEAVHARLSYDLFAHGYYRYDPTYHGPLLYFLTASIYGVLGDSDFTARLAIACAGVAMLWIAWRLRRPFGGRAAWWAASELYHGGTLDVRDGSPLSLPIRKPVATFAVRAVEGGIEIDPGSPGHAGGPPCTT